jgi:uncharacterized delta-60 repeat protein
MKWHTTPCRTLLCGILISYSATYGRAQQVPASAGSLDTSFFPATVVVPSWNGVTTIHRIVVQADGRALICGGFDHVQRNLRRGLARFESNGTFDCAFVPGVDFIQDLALEPDGKMVVAGTYRGLARLNPDGTLDPSFDGQVPDGATAVTRLPSGEFLAGIHIDNDPVDSSPRYGVALFDTQGQRSSRWSSAFRSSSPLSYLLLAPGGDRVITDGAVELALDHSDNNFRWLTNSLPLEFKVTCGQFQPDGKLLLGSGLAAGVEYPTNVTIASALVRLNPDGSLDTSFSTNVSVGMATLEGGSDQIRVAAIALQPDSRILIGGFFTRVDGEARSLVARLLKDGQLDPSFRPDLKVNPGWDIDALQNVSAMASTPEGKVLIGGVFDRCNGLECHSLVRLHTADDTGGGVLAFAQSTWYAWETNGPLDVAVLRYGPSNVTVTVAYEASAPPTGSETPPRGTLVFQPGETSKSITLPVQDNLIAEGNRSFQLTLGNPTGGAVLTGTPEARIVLLDNETAAGPGSVDLSFPLLSLDGYVWGATLLVVEADGSALLCVLSAKDRQSEIVELIRVGPDGQIDPTFHPKIDGQVYFGSTDAVSGKIFIYGWFQTVNGQSRPQVARLNHDGSLDAAFSVMADNWISGAWVQTDGKIVIYGAFESVNQVPRRRLARINQDGTVDAEFDTSNLTWTGGLDPLCITSQDDGKVILGGYFHEINGVARTNLARFNKNGSLDASFVPDPITCGSYIQALQYQPDGKLLLSGYLNLPGTGYCGVARLNGNGSHDTSFVAATPGAFQSRQILLQPDGKILLEGKWRLNSDGSRDYSYITGEESASVSGVGLLPNGDILVSGTFLTFAEWPRPWLVRLRGGDGPTPGFFEFADSYLNIVEHAGSAEVRVRRVGAVDKEAKVKITTADITARAKVDYLPFAQVLDFAPGIAEQTISIPILYRAGYQGSRSFEIGLQDQTGGVRSPSGSPIAVFILDPDPGLTFSQTNYWVSGDDISTNGAGAVAAYVQRYGDLSSTVTVHCQLVAGTAVAGQDFVATNVTVVFQPQQYEVPVVAPLLRNDAATGDRTLSLVLKEADPGWSLATGSTALLTIMGKLRPPSVLPGTLVLDSYGCALMQCDVWPGTWVDVEASTDLLNWTYIGYAYQAPNSGSPTFVDSDAWKYARRFYRIPLSSLGPD